MTSETEGQGIKNINIVATTRYPVVSAYEYEFLKQEKVVRDRMTSSTIYLILQRPLTYFQNVSFGPGVVRFEIVDDQHPPLRCEFPLTENGICAPGEDLTVKIQYYKTEPDPQPPHNDVAGLQFYRTDGTFVVWYSPQKFLYEVLAGGLNVRIDGDVSDYLDYHVHYIGQAFSQRVWKRLTGHEKMQRILTLEGPQSAKAQPAPFEISLLTLEVLGFDEANIFQVFDFAVPDGLEPIIYDFTYEEDDDRFLDYYEPKLGAAAPELTNEVEAMLVSLFQPTYNTIKFDNYPHLKKGTRSAGYTHATLTLQGVPVLLRTDTAQVMMGAGMRLGDPTSANESD